MAHFDCYKAQSTVNLHLYAYLHNSITASEIYLLPKYMLPFLAFLGYTDHQTKGSFFILFNDWSKQ